MLVREEMSTLISDIFLINNKFSLTLITSINYTLSSRILRTSLMIIRLIRQIMGGLLVEHIATKRKKVVIIVYANISFRVHCKCLYLFVFAPIVYEMYLLQVLVNPYQN